MKRDKIYKIGSLTVSKKEYRKFCRIAREIDLQDKAMLKLASMKL